VILNYKSLYEAVKIGVVNDGYTPVTRMLFFPVFDIHWGIQPCDADGVPYEVNNQNANSWCKGEEPMAGLFFDFLAIQMAIFLLQYIVRIIQLFVIDKQVIIMLKNNIEVDVKVKCIENEKTQAELAKEISITPSYVNRLIRKNENVVNKTFLAMMEALGYDVTLVYEKRDR